MKRLLDDAQPGQRFSDTRGATWVYVRRGGTDEEMLFPHVLTCLDTGQEDSFSPEGQDEFSLSRCHHRLEWAVTCR